MSRALARRATSAARDEPSHRALSNDTFATGGSGTFVDTEEFAQVASPATTTVYFVVTTDPNADPSVQTGPYTVTLRISR
jgi:hypothetical protein